MIILHRFQVYFINITIILRSFNFKFYVIFTVNVTNLYIRIYAKFLSKFLGKSALYYFYSFLMFFILEKNIFIPYHGSIIHVSENH